MNSLLLNINGNCIFVFFFLSNYCIEKTNLLSCMAAVLIVLVESCWALEHSDVSFDVLMCMYDSDVVSIWFGDFNFIEGNRWILDWLEWRLRFSEIIFVFVDVIIVVAIVVDVVVVVIDVIEFNCVDDDDDIDDGGGGGRFIVTVGVIDFNCDEDDWGGTGGVGVGAKEPVVVVQLWCVDDWGGAGDVVVDGWNGSATFTTLRRCRGSFSLACVWE